MAYKNNLDRSWINYIDLDIVDIYPIQFANCDRLLKNDSVYIFDEVGSGKTISSGLMALDFLMNNTDSNVLIVTTNALAKKGIGNEYGQFLKDWFDKLPFSALNLCNRIDIVNNHYSNLKDSHSYGLVIIDEAQIFLNKESLRYENLTKNIKAEKIVFLTATPIKGSQMDLYTYVDIASKILNKNDLAVDWIDKLCTMGKDSRQIICSTFDIESPVTRYFKDTIMCLNVDGFKKTQAKRLLPQLWEYDTVTNKKNKMLEKIEEKLQEDNSSRFVVFTHYVEKEAFALGDYLNKNGFVEYTYGVNNIKSYYIVTGNNSVDLALFSGHNNLPTVLILTYQIAEQGVNLPGFNYVINYHISSYPSALEQRFGRIDRMGKFGSTFPTINMCYLISANDWDINTANFYMAVSTYMYNLLSYLPSKNTLLSEKIIERYNQKKSLMKDYVDKLVKLCKTDKEIDKVINHYQLINQAYLESDKYIEDHGDSIEALGEDGENDLLKFCDDRGIIYDCLLSREVGKEKLCKDIMNEILEIKNQLGKEKQVPITLCKALLDKIEDKIFYCKSSFLKRIDYNKFNIEQDLGFLDAITECAELIFANKDYTNYSQTFNTNVRLPILFSNYRERINKQFENWFIQNKLHYIFPIEGYKKLFKEDILSQYSIGNKSDFNMLLDNCEVFVQTLPFFKMCRKYKEKLQGLCWTAKNEYRRKYDFDPFTTALGQLKYIELGLSSDFYNQYWKNYKEGSGYSNYYKEYIFIDKNSEGIVEASNWYKLAFHYTRKEEVAWVKFQWQGEYERYESMFRAKENVLRWLIENNNIGDINDPSFKDQYNKQIQNFKIIKGKLKTIIRCESLYHDFIITAGGNYRTYVENDHNRLISYFKNPTVWSNDRWTQGIYEDLFNISFNVLDYYRTLLGNNNELLSLVFS